MTQEYFWTEKYGDIAIIKKKLEDIQLWILSLKVSHPEVANEVENTSFDLCHIRDGLRNKEAK